ncbi:Uncharacterized protein APZ42_009347 [Daphnia magna]|uniref:Uncharacterized protein n=1 Tax=Daphnia magna TaxID=35525 RepID=A0A164E2K1_9CRUS|nr:Uncharacterized protein APZ42_009347 [Daphnia magna]
MKVRESAFAFATFKEKCAMRFSSSFPFLSVEWEFQIGLFALESMQITALLSSVS